jgi:hypothetical protein
MSIGLLFWVLMVLWLVSWVGTRWGSITGPYVYANEFLFFVLLFLLGWKSFGFILQA